MDGAFRFFNAWVVRMTGPDNHEKMPSSPPVETAPKTRVLSPAAERALAEAAERRKRAADKSAAERPTEIGGRGGEDPSRFGDWEINGRAIDF